MNYERLDPLSKGYIGNRDGAAVWWCSLYETILVLENWQWKLIWTSRRGEELDFT